MNTQQNKVPQNAEKLKEIPKWTRKYAQNRTLSLYVQIVIIVLISMVIAAPSYLAGAAFIKGNMTVLRVCIVVLFAILVFAFIICVSKFGGVIIRRWLDRLIYDHEGTASMPEPKLTKKKKWLEFVFLAVFIICIIGTIYFGMKGHLSFKYIQPVTALYFVPFRVYEYFLRRSRFGPLVLICPILYTIHAILIIAGVPIYFTGDFCFNGIIWNMFLPAVGYTFLAHVIAHLYSRYALKKLKTAAHLQEDTNEQ